MFVKDLNSVDYNSVKKKSKCWIQFELQVGWGWWGKEMTFGLGPLLITWFFTIQPKKKQLNEILLWSRFYIGQFVLFISFRMANNCFVVIGSSLVAIRWL